MLISGHDEVIMDFIADYEYIISIAYINDPAKLIFLPHAAYRVMRAAHNEQMHIIAACFFLEVLKINTVFAVFENKRIFYDDPVV